MTNNTIPNVPRELKPVLAMILNALDRDAADGKQARAEMAAELRTILSAPSPAGVGGLEVVGVLCISRFRNNPAMENVEFQLAADVEQGQHDLCRLSDAQAIIDGLRGEVAAAEGKWRLLDKALTASVDAEMDLLDRVTSAIQQRDQQAQRIGELEGLLRGFAVGISKREMPAEQELNGWFDRIDAALSAGKEGE